MAEYMAMAGLRSAKSNAELNAIWERRPGSIKALAAYMPANM
jgi:hypothetical protein